VGCVGSFATEKITGSERLLDGEASRIWNEMKSMPYELADRGQRKDLVGA